MYEVTKETIANAYRPFDIVTDEDGNVGFIKEVSVNDCQTDPKHQISYAIRWLIGNAVKCAWFKHEELTFHKNLLICIAEESCHPFGRGKEWVDTLLTTERSKKKPT